MNAATNLNGRKYNILARPLHANEDGQRWRYVIQDVTGEPFTAWSSRYCYQSATEAADAGRADLPKLRLRRPL